MKELLEDKDVDYRQLDQFEETLKEIKRLRENTFVIKRGPDNQEQFINLDYDDIMGSEVSSFFNKNKAHYRADQMNKYKEESEYVP
jgi:hypothetical protein